MKKYVAPDFEVTIFEIEDVITTSGQPELFTEESWGN